MEIDYENEKLDEIFNEYKNDDNNNNNKLKQINFDKNSINNNKKILEKYENLGLIKKNNYYSLDENECENPIKINKKKKHKNYFDFILEDNLNNENFYCGYLDNLDKIKNNNSKNKQIFCSACFNLISNNLKEKNNEFCVANKCINVFKDYLNLFNFQNIFEEFPNFKENLQKIYDEDVLNNQQKLIVSVQCEKCNNFIGFYENLENNYIIYNYL